MANHTIYVRNLEMLARVKEMAKAEGISFSRLVERELRVWVEREERLRARVKAERAKLTEMRREAGLE